jgi:pimeloyl-ACP methyl ester carboxylesterase
MLASWLPSCRASNRTSPPAVPHSFHGPNIRKSNALFGLLFNITTRFFGLSMLARELTLTFVRDDVKLHVREWGAGRDACLLLHGFGEGAYVWNRFAPAAAHLFRTLAVDLRGHGDSTWDAMGRYPIENHVGDVLRAIQTLRLDRLVIVGHSLGGDIALRVAAALPTDVVGLALVDFGLDPLPEGAARVQSDFNESMRTWDSTEEYAWWLRARRPLVDFEVTRELAASALRSVAKGGFRPKCDPAMGIREGTGDRKYMWQLIKRITCPVLVVRGIGSAVFSDLCMRQMNGVLRNGRIRTVNRAGHAVMNDNPEGFAEALYPFLLDIRTMSRAEGCG